MKRRDHALDVIRILAIATVVLMHIQRPFTGMGMWVAITVASMGVPLFVMLTGYLMVDREYDGSYIHRFLTRNLLPLLVAFEVWNLVGFLYGRLTGRNVMTVGRMLRIALFMGPTQSAFWFLQMIIGVYLGLPIVSIVIHHLIRQGARTYMLMLAGCVVVFGTLIPTAGQFYGIFLHGQPPQSVISMNVFGANVWGSSCWMLYLLAGYLVKRLRQDRDAAPHIGTPWLVLVFAASFAASAYFGLVTARHGKGAYPTYANVFLVMAVISLFMIITRIPSLSTMGNGHVARAIELASKLSFGVYMIHTYIAPLAQPLLDQAIGNRHLLFFCSFIVCYLASLAVGWLLSKNAIAGKWLLLMK